MTDSIDSPDRESPQDERKQRFSEVMARTSSKYAEMFRRLRHERDKQHNGMTDDPNNLRTIRQWAKYLIEQDLTSKEILSILNDETAPSDKRIAANVLFTYYYALETNDH